MAKFCQNCGSSLEGEPKFCPSCGAKVIVTPQQDAPKPPEQQQELQNPPVERQTPQPPMKQEAAGQPQPMTYQNAPGQGAPNAYDAQNASMFGAGAYVPDEGFVQMFLRYDNRLNRKRYIMRALALVVAVSVVATVLGVVLAVAGASASAIENMGTAVGLLGAVSGIMLVIRRLHDLDRPTWWIVGNFIPIVNIAFSLYLLFAKGTEGPNQYGPDPLEGMH